MQGAEAIESLSDSAGALDGRSSEVATSREVELEEANRELAEASAAEATRWAADTFGPRLVLSSSFGAQSAVMLHLVSQHAPGTPVIFIDTGHLFPETYRFAHDLSERLRLDLRVFSPKLTAAHQEALYGRLWEQGEEGVAEYLRINKVEPMQRALRELGAVGWLAGLRANQTEHRAGLDRVTMQGGRYKVHPILHWRQEDIDAYLDAHDLPLHPLVEQGYRSIGDTHSTLPTLPGQDPREGRLLGQKRECGIHLSDDENKSLTSSKL
ncbi:MAG: phosphoadenylyl-sulfate reductase [Myxococcota bacterium]